MKRDTFQNLQRNLKRMRSRQMEHIKAEAHNHGTRRGYECGYFDGKQDRPMWTSYPGFEWWPR